MGKKAVILAGGRGSRLWPLSRLNSPKQFIDFLGGESLFQLSLKRTLQIFTPEEIFVVTSYEYRFRVLNQIDLIKDLKKQEKSYLRKNVFFEPESRSTLGAILFLFKNLKNIKNEDVFAIFPSDHIIYPPAYFRRSIKKAVTLAKRRKIVVLGVSPSEVNSNYGYILPTFREKDIFIVRSFIEKPSQAKARSLIKRGALWNCGIFCFRKDVFEEELRKVNPSFFSFYKKKKDIFNKEFSLLPAQSLDYGLMEKTHLGWGVKLEGEWSDLGTWDSFFSFFNRPEHKSKYLKSKIISFLGAGNYSVWTNKLVVGIGVRDLFVIDSPDALLLLKKGKSSYVKNAVKYLDKEKQPEVNNRIKVWRPWGYYIVLQEDGRYKVKEICLYPHKCISLQLHKHRSEHWNVVEGTARVVLGRKNIILRRNESIFVRKKQKHKLCNPSSQRVKIIEVQIGDYLGEDDIERFDDY